MGRTAMQIWLCLMVSRSGMPMLPNLSSLQGLHTATHIQITHSGSSPIQHFYFFIITKTTDIKNENIQTKFNGVQNYVTNGPVIQQPHSTNLFKTYLICILIKDFLYNIAF
jgi:hypothetical protein